MLQWLFWLLAIVAYGCIAYAIIGLLPAGSLGPVPGVDVGGGRGRTAGFAFAGLVAGAAAWWFARGLARGQRSGADRAADAVPDRNDARRDPY